MYNHFSKISFIFILILFVSHNAQARLVKESVIYNADSWGGTGDVEKDFAIMKQECNESGGVHFLDGQIQCGFSDDPAAVQIENASQLLKSNHVDPNIVGIDENKKQCHVYSQEVMQQECVGGAPKMVKMGDGCESFTCVYPDQAAVSNDTNMVGEMNANEASVTSTDEAIAPNSQENKGKQGMLEREKNRQKSEGIQKMNKFIGDKGFR